MRIIGGQLKRQRILGPPKGADTRPYPDMVRQAVFNLLRGHFEGASVLDAFSGTGSMGLEAASRGADRVVFVERDRRVARVIEQNIETLALQDQCEIAMGDALGPSALARCPKPCDVIFFDPPYALVRDTKGWDRTRLALSRLMAHLTPAGFAVLRTPWPHTYSPGQGEHPLDFDLTIDGAEGPETHDYGNTAVHLYMRAKPLSEPPA